jgi:hypothetical protein
MPILLEKHVFIKSRFKIKTFGFGHQKKFKLNQNKIIRFK